MIELQNSGGTGWGKWRIRSKKKKRSPKRSLDSHNLPDRPSRIGSKWLCARGTGGLRLITEPFVIMTEVKTALPFGKPDSFNPSV